MAYLLKKSSFTSSRKDTVKFKLNCQERINSDTQDTRGWIEILKKIQNVNILLGRSPLIKKHIVVKFESYSEIKKEYNISKILFELGIPNFIKYYCFFSCDEDRTKFEKITDPIPLCTGPGSNTGFVLMPFYPLGSMAQYKWMYSKLPVLKNILMQVSSALITAYEKEKFVHLDLHLDNILLRTTEKKELIYSPILPAIQPLGLYSIIIDFGRSKINGNYSEFTTSLLKMFSLLRDIGPKTEFILDPIPLVSYIRYSETIDPIHLFNLIGSLSVDYLK